MELGMKGARPARPARRYVRADALAPARQTGHYERGAMTSTEGLYPYLKS